MTQRWQFWLPILVTIAVGILPLLQTELMRDSRRLEHHVVSISSIADKKDVKLENLKFLYRDKELDNVSVLLTRLTNTGSVAIKSLEFEREIRMRFPPETQVLFASSVGGLTPEVKYDDHTVIIPPLLLNPNDFLDLRILLSGKRTLPIVDARIAGIQKVEERIPTKIKFPRDPWNVWADFLVGVVLMSMAVSFFLLYFIKGRECYPQLTSWELLLWALAGWVGGWDLIGYWGESINFMLKPQPWSNIAACFLLVCANIFFWLKIRR